LNNQTIEKLYQMRLHTMAAAFREQMEQPQMGALSFEERFAIPPMAREVAIEAMTDPFERDDEYMRFQAQAAAFIRARDRLLGLGMSPEEQAIWARARELIQRDERLHAQVLELDMAYQSEAALAILLRDVRPLELELLDVFNEMVEQYRQANQQSLLESEADYRKASAYMLGLAGLVLAMGWVIARAVIRRSLHAESELSRQSRVAVAAAEQLSWAASHDSLTGLANRREMQRRLGELIEDARVQGVRHVLFYIDLEGHETDAAVAAALAELKVKAPFIKILGSYPAAVY